MASVIINGILRGVGAIWIVARLFGEAEFQFAVFFFPFAAVIVGCIIWTLVDARGVKL